MVALQGARRFSWLHTSFAGASVRTRGPSAAAGLAKGRGRAVIGEAGGRAAEAGRDMLNLGNH